MRYFWQTVITGVFLLGIVCALALMRARKRDRAIAYVALSNSGRWIAAGTSSGRITICDRKRAGACRTVDARDGALNDLQFSPDERFLAIADEGVQLSALDHAERLFLLRSDRKNYGTVRFNNAGTELLTVTGRGEIEVINLRSGATMSKICCSSIYGEAAFSADGEMIFNAGHWPGVWNAQGRLLRRLTADREDATFGPIVIDDERQTVFMGSQDGRVYGWSLRNYNLLMRSKPHNEYVNSIAIVKETGGIAYAGFGKTVRLWNPESGGESQLSELKPTSNLVALADGRSILFGTSEGFVELWDLHAKPVRTDIVAALE